MQITFAIESLWERLVIDRVAERVSPRQERWSWRRCIAIMVVLSAVFWGAIYYLASGIFALLALLF